MCGIAGVLLRRGRADEGALRRMGDALAHRGPDDLGVHLDGSFGLLQTRLSIIDLERGHQPMTDGPLTLAANGEIYNFVELRRALEARGRRFATNSDSETILHAYALDGPGALASFNGMFAFALYDARRAELLLGRDRLGIKPLYYAQLPDRLLFASELKALLAVWPGEPALDPGALVQYLQNHFNTGEDSLVRGIRRLPPGTTLVGRRRPEGAGASLLVAARRAAARARLRGGRGGVRAAVPAGDARAPARRRALRVVPVERRRLGRAAGDDERAHRSPGAHLLHRLSGGRPSELPDAKAIAHRFGAEHTEIVLDRDAALRRLPHTVWATDDLLHDYACLPTSFLAEQAARGLKVILTGEGGDEVFAGYGRYRRTGPQRWLKNLVAPGSGGFRTRGQWTSGWARRVLGGELRAAAAARRAPFITAWQAAPPAWSDVTHCQYTDLCTWLPDDLLVKADRVLMGFGLEGRVPFLDHRVVEFGLGLSDGLKIGGRHGKLFLKRWAERRIPREHLWRRKRGFYVPVRGWLRGDFLEALATHLPRHPVIRRWFSGDAVAALVRTQQRGGNTARAIWGLLQLAIWHRIFIEGRVPGRDEDPIEWIA